jgi:hypothetical protein
MIPQYRLTMRCSGSRVVVSGVTGHWVLKRILNGHHMYLLCKFTPQGQAIGRRGLLLEKGRLLAPSRPCDCDAGIGAQRDMQCIGAKHYTCNVKPIS